MTRDSAYIGGVSGPDPARAPPKQGDCQAGLACPGAAGWGLLASKVRPCGAPLPPRAACACSRLGHTPESVRSGGGHQCFVARRFPTTSVARGADVPVCLGRPGERLAGRGWLGQGFHQRPDLGIGVASVPAQGAEVGQPALLCPAAHRLWRHMEELGDLRCTEVPRLSWRWHQCAPFWPVSPMWGTTLRSSGANAIQRSTQWAAAV